MANKAIGPNFVNELKAAGLDPIPPISWDTNWVIYTPTMTAPQRAIVDAVYLAHDPTVIPAATLRDQSMDTAIGNDSVVSNLKAMTATQFDTWWAANVTNAAQAIAVLKVIARLVIRKLL